MEQNADADEEEGDGDDGRGPFLVLAADHDDHDDAVDVEDEAEGDEGGGQAEGYGEVSVAWRIVVVRTAVNHDTRHMDFLVLLWKTRRRTFAMRPWLPLIIVGTLTLAGCVPPARKSAELAQPRPETTSPAIGSSEILGAYRRQTESAGDSEVDISVAVKISGTLTGIAQEFIDIYGPVALGSGPRESRIMLTTGESRGYPFAYRATVEYTESSDQLGAVNVIVVIDDTKHPSYGLQIYRAKHQINWAPATRLDVPAIRTPPR